MTVAAVLSDVTHRFEGAAALHGVTLSIAPGEVVALLGPSGAGKSTLLTLLDGRLRGWKGAAEVLGAPLSPHAAPVRPRRADVGFIFQEFALVERQSVYRNAMNGRLGRTRIWPSIWGRFGEGDHMAVAAALRDTGIADLAARRADRLSGGQRQRVAIARCLAQEPRLILADEPVSNLDPEHSGKILALIAGEARKRGIAAIFSCHQPILSQRHASRAVGLRDGRILFDHPVGRVSGDDMARLYRGSVPGAELRAVG